MTKFPEQLNQQLNQRKATNTLRELGTPNQLIDFSSNDYLGFSKCSELFKEAQQLLENTNITQNGATGSRLLSGNHKLYTQLEAQLCQFHNAEAALVYNSGYTANLGFFSSVPRRGDIILYDELIHASIRDGITLSNAKAYKFKHNNLEHLNTILDHISYNGNVYVVTESVFSMDGDSPDLVALSKLCKLKKYYLIVDEAHALGVFGNYGCGLVQHLNLENDIFARLITFGKALGCHGAVILGSVLLKSFLVNFSRPFIYTTGLPPHAIATIIVAYNRLSNKNTATSLSLLQNNIVHFKTELRRFKLKNNFISSNSAIQCCIISNSNSVKKIAQLLEGENFNVKPILAPTVPKGQERLRFCLHSYNNKASITKVLEILSTFNLNKF